MIITKGADLTHEDASAAEMQLCMKLLAMNAAEAVRCPLNPVATNQCTAADVLNNSQKGNPEDLRGEILKDETSAISVCTPQPVTTVEMNAKFRSDQQAGSLFIAAVVSKKQIPVIESLVKRVILMAG